MSEGADSADKAFWASVERQRQEQEDEEQFRIGEELK